MIDPKVTFRATCYLGDFERNLLPRPEDDFATEAEANYFIDMMGCGGTIEKYDGKSWVLVAVLLPEGQGGVALTA